jgi:hypothetical protein
LDPIALFAAAVATASLIWQGYTWLQSRRVRIELEVFLAYTEATADFENKTPYLRELENSLRICNEILQAGTIVSTIDSSQRSNYYRQLERAVARYNNESPWPDLMSRFNQRAHHTDDLPNVIVVNVYNDGDRNVEVRLLTIVQAGRHRSGRRRNQDGFFPRRPNLAVSANSVAQTTIWINTALVSDFELSKKLQIEVELWTGKRFRSKPVQLIPREAENLIEEKYSKLNQRMDLDGELKYRLQAAGINSVHDLKRLLRQ